MSSLKRFLPDLRAKETDHFEIGVYPKHTLKRHWLLISITDGRSCMSAGMQAVAQSQSMSFNGNCRNIPAAYRAKNLRDLSIFPTSKTSSRLKGAEWLLPQDYHVPRQAF